MYTNCNHTPEELFIHNPQKDLTVKKVSPDKNIFRLFLVSVSWRKPVQSWVDVSAEITYSRFVTNDKEIFSF